jgi:hypothetical protein
MVYTASLNVPVKKALGKQAVQSNLNKICEQITLDPDTTNMDVVFLGPRDLVGPKATKIQQVLRSKHPDICVIYLYNKSDEADLIDCEYKKQCKKISVNEVNEAFEEFVGQHKIRQGKQQISSADFDASPNVNLGQMPANSGYGSYGMSGDDEVYLAPQSPIQQSPAMDDLDGLETLYLIPEMLNYRNSSLAHFLFRLSIIQHISIQSRNLLIHNRLPNLCCNSNLCIRISIQKQERL